jgi:tellurite resistance protein TerC
MTSVPSQFWLIFGSIVLVLIALDLFVFNRRSHTIRFREAVLWTCFWMGIALSFNLFVYFTMGTRPALEFLTGYVVEQSLSVDNLFVFALILRYFGVPEAFMHRVLYLGILMAILFRAIFIAAGVALLHQFHWIVYVFGAMLVLTGVRMVFQDDETLEPEKNPVIRLFRRIIPVTEHYEGNRFFVRRSARLWATPLFIVVLFLAVTDIVFAVDSIPAVLAITQDTFIVYTSNIFAVLGLRALFFVLAGVLNLFHHLRYGLAVILVFVGAKMLGSSFIEVPIGVSLGVIAGVLALSILASLLWPKRDEAIVPVSSEDAPGPH